MISDDMIKKNKSLTLINVGQKNEKKTEIFKIKEIIAFQINNFLQFKKSKLTKLKDKKFFMKNKINCRVLQNQYITNEYKNRNTAMLI
ncbi:hypothetical protein BpHYR1_047207 [Brachionus plicatilis]|uniref:Uncharacterized protein n=1 Tax=Brachionus plicatilis TaxID=10195 RepID=A0A3M7QGR2_BRAPC|nr:hypothetical protein BpHYR1_047207 [Brachionus plicatilis]